MQALFCLLVTWGAVVALPGGGECPRDCTCQEAPLRAASFVLTWMTSWGEDDLPEMHPNEVGEAGDLVNSLTATSAGVDVDVVGLHATCALTQGTNLTTLLHALPPSTMVLTILQAAGSEMTVVEAKHLQPLTQLLALHLQGYAKRQAVQVSGYFSNRVEEMVEHKQQAKIDEEDQDLRLALSEDALTPIDKLQLLDLQYVRLVGAVEGGRLRRTTEPISTSTVLDMPLNYFLSLTQHLKDIDLPPEILSKMSNEQPKVDVVLLEEDEDEVVPYDVFKIEKEVLLAPFTAQVELKYLRLAHAKLDHIGPELLTGLSGLHTLTLEHNHIKVLPAAMFTPTPHLHHLSLAHNNILTLEGSSLTSLDELLTLDLDGNKLDRIGPVSFPLLPKIATLRLIANPLEHIFPFAFTNVNSTETLLVGSRDVAAEIHVDSFRHLNSLRVLQIENTTLPSLSRSLLEGMPNLQELTIHGHVPTIDFDTFTATSKLDSLSLDHTHLSKLSIDAFFGLRKLRFLDLSHNDLEELSPGTFDHLASLRELYLHHNNLTTLPPAIFLPLPAKLIQVHQNPWDCTCDLLQLRPAFTNKVRAKGYTTCRFLERSGVVCSEPDPPRIRYDSRVAPLCATPERYSRRSVFRVTARRLKCPKHKLHIWNPRMQMLVPSSPVSPASPQGKNEEKVETPVVEEDSWLPLHAFSVPPHHVKDLLEIAEAEMPEEAYAPLPEDGEEDDENEGQDANSEELIEEIDGELQTMRNILEEDANVHPFDVAERFVRRQRERYQLEKQLLKKQLEDEQRRREEAVRSMKQRHWDRLRENKRRLKAQMAEKQQRILERREEAMNILLMKNQEPSNRAFELTQGNNIRRLS